jgi:hypothetical protein
MHAVYQSHVSSLRLAEKNEQKHLKQDFWYGWVEKHRAS